MVRIHRADYVSLVGTVLGPIDLNSIDGIDRQVDNSTLWTVSPGGNAVNNGRGQLVRSGTNAPLFRAIFPTSKANYEEEQEKHAARIAMALGLDRAQRVLEVNLPPHRQANGRQSDDFRTQWNGREWINDRPIPRNKKPPEHRALPTAPFK